MIDLIIGFVIAGVLFVVEYFLCVKLKNPLWGGIIPMLILIGTADRYPCMVYHFQVREWLVEVQNELLGHAIERLTPYRQEIILLYFFLGFKNKEIAALYGCNAGKISYHKMRAVRQIRSEMEVRRHE